MTLSTVAPATPTREALLSALSRFASQRPRLDFADYGDVSAYRSESRSIGRDLADFRALLSALSWRDSITAEHILEASKNAFSGRLEFHVAADGVVSVSYCTGQYYPTEYRKAACAVLARALWANRADDNSHLADKGEVLRRSFRREFGRGLASRWFN